eukprot:3701761-Pleurochrysis_carterae.AAC.8
MASNDSKYAVAKKCTNKGRADFLKFKGNLKDILHFHEHKLLTILFVSSSTTSSILLYDVSMSRSSTTKVAAADKKPRMK